MRAEYSLIGNGKLYMYDVFLVLIPIIHLLFLPAKLVESPFKIVYSLTQRVIRGCLLCRQVVVCLLHHLMVGLAQATWLGHLGLGALLVVSTEVFPLLRGGASGKHASLNTTTSWTYCLAVLVGISKNKNSQFSLYIDSVKSVSEVTLKIMLKHKYYKIINLNQIN